MSGPDRSLQPPEGRLPSAPTRSDAEGSVARLERASVVLPRHAPQYERTESEKRLDLPSLEGLIAERDADEAERARGRAWRSRSEGLSLEALVEVRYVRRPVCEWTKKEEGQIRELMAAMRSALDRDLPLCDPVYLMEHPMYSCLKDRTEVTHFVVAGPMRVEAAHRIQEAPKRRKKRWHSYPILIPARVYREPDACRVAEGELSQFRQDEIDHILTTDGLNRETERWTARARIVGRIREDLIGQHVRKFSEKAAEQLVEVLGPDKPLGSFRLPALLEALSSLEKEHKWADSTRLKFQKNIKHFFEFARVKLDAGCVHGGDLVTLEADRVEPTVDTLDITYSDEEYSAMLAAAKETDFLMAAMLTCGGVFGRRKGQTLKTPFSQVSRDEIVVDVEGSRRVVRAIRVDWLGKDEKAAKKGQGVTTVARFDEIRHPKEFEIWDRYLETDLAKSARFCFPDLRGNETIDSTIPGDRGRLGDKGFYRRFRDVEAAAGVEYVEKRGFHGLKRLAISRCRTEEELRLVARLSNTAYKTCLDIYHQFRSAFENEDTMRREEAAIVHALRSAA